MLLVVMYVVVRTCVWFYLFLFKNYELYVVICLERPLNVLICLITNLCCTMNLYVLLCYFWGIMMTVIVFYPMLTTLCCNYGRLRVLGMMHEGRSCCMSHPNLRINLSTIISCAPQE